MSSHDPRTLMTTDRVERICEVLETKACSLRAAAAYVGISPWTIYDWMTRGKKEETGPYRDFFLRVEEAKRKGELTLLDHVHAAAPHDWKAAAFLLKSRFPEDYSERFQIAKQLQSMSDDELDQYLEGALAEPPPVGEIGPGGEDAPGGSTAEEDGTAVIDASYAAEGPA